MRAKIKRIDGHHFQFSVRGMTGEMDVAIEGKPVGPSPKELILAALCGCTGTDVVDLMKKFGVEYETLEIEARAELTDIHPKVYRQIELMYFVQSTTDKKEMIIEAVKRSTHQYSGTAAMLVKTCPIHYKIFLNKEVLDEGDVDFSEYLQKKS